MLSTNGEDQLIVFPRGINTDFSGASGQPNPSDSCQNETSPNGKKAVATQDQDHKTLTIPPQDKNGSHELHLPSYSEDSDSLQKVDGTKLPQDSTDRKDSFAINNDLSNVPSLMRSQSLNFVSSAAKSKGIEDLSLDDSPNYNGSGQRKHRKTEPNLVIRKPANRKSAPLFFPPSQWSARYGIQFFTVVVPTVSVVNGTKGSYAEYHLEIKRGRQVIVRKYRYSQFAEFHKSLLSSSISIILQKGKIYLPSRTWFKNVSESFLQQRRLELEKYLHHLLQFKYSPRERIVQKFLGLNEFVVKDFWIDH